MSPLDKKAEKILDQFSQENLPFVLTVLKGVNDAVEFGSGGEGSYTLQFPTGHLRVREESLLYQFYVRGLFKLGKIDARLEVVVFWGANKALIKRCLQKGTRRLAMAEVKRRMAVAGAGKRLILEEKARHILKWSVFTLNAKTGMATINNKTHSFDLKRPPFIFFKVLLEKRLNNRENGEVTFEELTAVATGIKDKEKIKATIRGLRRNLGINRKKNPLEDIFRDTGNGYELIPPQS